MRIALVTVFVLGLFIFAWARWDLPTRGGIDKWKERAWDINPRIFFLGMKAVNEYRSAIATGSFLVSVLALFTLVVLQYLGK
jgi:hypothetical protein